jgi:DNA-binding transcriptional ArsR family regulator
MNAARTDRLFAALAHRARRRMLDLLAQAPGMTVTALASHFDMSRIASMKHLRALEAAGLVLSERRGRTRRLFLDPSPIQEIYDRWTTRLTAFWASRMADIKTRVERRAKETRRA